MALAHLTVAGVVEFALTAGVIAYLQRANLPLLRINHAARAGDRRRAGAAAARSAGAGRSSASATLVVLTPLGLLAPGGAFGEDAPDDLDLQKYHLDAVPTGLRALRRVLAPRAVRRLRLHRRQPPDARLPRLGRSSASLVIAVVDLRRAPPRPASSRRRRARRRDDAARSRVAA